ncbi:MAG: PaaI family thioesterase [Actinomycetota bacterium]|nr:PaaI family thioesterase [Actinomycetota bacterium]
MWLLIDNPFEDGVTYVGHSGIELTDANAEFCSGRVEIQDFHRQPYGVVHGGVYCTLAETIASTAAAIWAMERGFAGAVGITNKTDFLKATTEGVLIAEATPIHRGRTQQLWQVNITREEDGRLVAQSQVRLQNVGSTDFEP